MEYRALGRTGTNVSTICLGTMTLVSKIPKLMPAAQLDFAYDRGVNFVDAAEMYPVPPMPIPTARRKPLSVHGSKPIRLNGKELFWQPRQLPQDVDLIG